MKYFLLTTIILFSVFITDTSLAWDCMGKNKKQNMVAVVDRISANQTWLHVTDERTRNKQSFFAARGRLKTLKTGDRVRIYYYCGSHTLLSLKKMTPVEFDAETSNRGYIQGAPK